MSVGTVPWDAMTPEYLFPHHIVLGYVALWTLAEVAAARVWPIRQSCKKISLLHCVVIFFISSVWLMHRFFTEDPGGLNTGLYNFEMPGTIEHHIISLSMAYFMVDMPFALAFHRAFIVHHILCIIAFAAIQGYWKYLPENTPFFMDFMAWDTTPTPQKSHVESDLKQQLLMGGLNGVFNLWMAELGGVFFHINRGLTGTDMELPSRGVFLMMFTFTRCFVWPMYLWHLYSTAATNDTYFHKVSAVLETALFLTNIHFLYKNIAPIWKTGRLMPHKPKGFHREWFDEHPSCQKVASVFFRQDKLSMSPGSASSVSDARLEGVDSAVQKKKN